MKYYFPNLPAAGCLSENPTWCCFAVSTKTKFQLSGNKRHQFSLKLKQLVYPTQLTEEKIFHAFPIKEGEDYIILVLFLIPYNDQISSSFLYSHLFYPSGAQHFVKRQEFFLGL